MEFYVFRVHALVDDSYTYGEEYVVYGILCIGNKQYYLLCDDKYDKGTERNYPVFVESSFLKIIDYKHSKYWKKRHRFFKNENVEQFGFSSMFIMDYFCGKTMNLKDMYLINMFSQYKRLLDSESELDEIDNELSLESERMAKINWRRGY